MCYTFFVKLIKEFFMKKKILSLIIALFIVICSLPACSPSAEDSIKALENNIAILYENDVHCAVEGYTKLAALKQELKSAHDHVGVVSVGDFVQGGSLGTVSQGEYIINLMNIVEYDAIALGNHEFDYRLPRLMELIGMMKTKPVCSNFYSISENKSVFEPYSIVSYGDTDIAYIGITTPSTISSSSPSQFMDEDGNFIYTFNPNNLFDIVQDSIDAAKKDGADYIIALSHIGTEDGENYSTSIEIAENTEGLDVILDGHSHSVIEEMTVTDEGGNEVIISSTGTKFEYIGKLTIENGEINTSLVKTEECEGSISEVDTYLTEISEAYKKLGERKIGTSDVELVTNDADGNRLVRKSETNLGNLCADAFRIVTGADIGYINGGGVRAAMPAGDVTFNDILGVYPFNNQVVVCEINGQAIKDMLEFAMKYYPEENGSFPHTSGLKFSVHTDIASTAEQDENEVFTKVSGEYRVYDIQVLNSESGKYEPIDLNKTYTFASHNYMILEQGSGMSMFKDARILTNDGMLDVELLEKYIVENLGGHIGEQYATVENRITFTK